MRTGSGWRPLPTSRPPPRAVSTVRLDNVQDHPVESTAPMRRLKDQAPHPCPPVDHHHREQWKELAGSSMARTPGRMPARVRPPSPFFTPGVVGGALVGD